MFKKKINILLVVLFIIIFGCTVAFSNFTEFTDSCATINDCETEVINNQFSDVKESDWFYSDVRYVNENGLMNGTGGNSFSPNDTTTRAMVVTILWRLEGEPIEQEKNFSDVKKDSYYYNAVNWGYNNEIVSGYNETSFGPEDAITREQLATIIYRYAIYKNYDISTTVSLDKYEDAKLISNYALPAIKWANEREIITGTSKDTLSPQGNALRCQVAAILKRFCTHYDLNNKDTPDVSNAKSNSETISSGTKTDDKLEGVTTPSEKKNDEKRDDYPIITVTSDSANPGENVQVLIKINNNPGILGMTLTAHYDETCLILESVQNGEAVKDVLNLTTSKSLASGVRFAWDGLDITPDNTKDGTILYMNFNISDTAKSGRYPISLTYAEGDIVDGALTSILLPIEKGYITVN